jgi:hypothetical protein
MGWPYQFVDLTEAQKVTRRTLLDTYGLVAQVSAGVVLIMIQLIFVAQWARRKGNGSDVPSSPSLKNLSKGSSLNTQAIARRWRGVDWWAGDSLTIFGVDLGTKGQATAAVCWTVWLLILCFAQTGKGKYL